MFLLNKASETGTRTAVNLDTVTNLSLVIDSGTLAIFIGTQKVLDQTIDESITAESLTDRFDDVIEALANGAKVYDIDKPVGAWKPKSAPKHTTRKSTPKPAPKKESA